MKVGYSATFLKQYQKLSRDLQKEVKEKIALFTEVQNHKRLNVHKLHGRASGAYSFSVNYQIRIVFDYIGTKPKSAVLLDVGNHDIYK